MINCPYKYNKLCLTFINGRLIQVVSLLWNENSMIILVFECPSTGMSVNCAISEHVRFFVSVKIMRTMNDPLFELSCVFIAIAKFNFRRHINLNNPQRKMNMWNKQINWSEHKSALYSKKLTQCEYVRVYYVT